MKTLHATLCSAALAYDDKQAKKPGHNRFALPQYLAMIDDVCADVERGADVRAAIVAGFSGRLAQAMLKAAGQSSYTEADARSGGVFYTPVKRPD
jgi:hypothetical protein